MYTKSIAMTKSLLCRGVLLPNLFHKMVIRNYFENNIMVKCHPRYVLKCVRLLATCLQQNSGLCVPEKLKNQGCSCRAHNNPATPH